MLFFLSNFFIIKTMKKEYKNLITGIQPTGDGNLHIGNYCGFMYDIKKILDKTHSLINIHEENIYILLKG